ncbi:helix-turn-helix domain-containing protein [Patulibacter americanus]|uniref:helix-turn-helix domain-containing protein n=1 Tax=Patulibacter americanus TaxID=588672 RepID=UPI0003B593B3|nr:helix-turn-helix transcriptional regulator [Patulibacter americanus]
MDPNDLGSCLRTWRDRLDPAVAGIAPTRRRRTPGLRRQEVATLAGLSVEYLARLEQGRAARPSAEVLGPLARALRLSADERDHLFRLAGHAVPGAGSAGRHVTPAVARIVDRLGDAAVRVIDVEWNVVLSNPLAVALLGPEASAPGRPGNVLLRQFTDVPSRVVQTVEERDAFEAHAVADLRDALGRFPGDDRLRAFVDDLRRTSDRFRTRWETGAVAPSRGILKRIVHPDVGEIVVDCDVLADASSDLRLVVYSAETGTPAARALALLDAIGTQDLAVESAG